MRAILDHCGAVPLEHMAGGSVILEEGQNTGRVYVLVEGRIEVLRGVHVIQDAAGIFPRSSHLSWLVARLLANRPGSAENLAAAARWGWEVKVGFRKGIDPFPKIPAAAAAAPAPVLVKDVLEQYLARRVRPRLKSAHALEVQLKHELQPWLGRPIASIGPADIHALMDALIDRTKRGIAANRFISHASPMFTFAVGRSTVPSNPFIGIRRPVTEVARDRVLDDEELVKILVAAREGLDNRQWEFVWLLAITAARRSEVAKMRWSEIDRSTWLWTIPKERSKNGKGHTIALPWLAIEVLIEITRGDEFVLGGVNGFTPYDGTKKQLDKLLPDMPHWTWHDLRRSAATHMAELGVQPHIVDRCLNHQTGSRIARTYNRFTYAPEMKAAFERWGGHLEVLLYGEPETNVVELRR